MSEQINKVLASTAQSFTDAEKAQARDNIGAGAASAYSGFMGVNHDSNLSGDGSTATPLGLNSAINFERSGDFYGSSLAALGWTPGAEGVGSSNGLLVSAYSGSKAVKVTYAGMYVNHPASGVGGDAQTSYYGASPDLWYNGSSQYLKHTGSTSPECAWRTRVCLTSRLCTAHPPHSSGTTTSASKYATPLRFTAGTT